MEAGVLAALLTSATSLAAASASLWVQRASLFEARAHEERSQVKVALERYRGPVLSAASELGDRLDNIRTRRFNDFHLHGGRVADAARLSTLFRLAQYLAWREILRVEVQLLPFSEASDTRLAASLIGDTAWVLASQALDDGLGMLWADQQRGIGELMLTTGHDGRVVCRGFASFVAEYDESLRAWLEPLTDFWLGAHAASRHRLRLLQWALLALTLHLDVAAAYRDRAWVRRTRQELAAFSEAEQTDVEARVRADLEQALSLTVEHPR